MRSTSVTYLLFTFLFLSCSDRKGKQKAALGDSLTAKPEHTITQKNSNQDTIIIDKKAVLFFRPDSIQIEKTKKENEQDFYTAADDNEYYMSLARQFTDSMHLNAIDIENQNFFKFISRDGSFVVIRKDTLLSLWGVYFFDPKKKPVEADITDIEEEYKSYF